MTNGNEEKRVRGFRIDWPVVGMSAGGIAIIAVVVLLIFRMMFVNFVDSYELGYIYNAQTGKITVLSRTGYIVSRPFLDKVHTVDLRPMQVCINANSRVLNCKLVKFNPAGLELFLSWHGRSDYDGGGSSTSQTGGIGGTKFNQILMSYAYDGSGRIYPFLDVIRELKPEEVAQK